MPAPAPIADAPGRAPGAERRAGTLAGVAAYSLWGVFPLVFHQLASVGAGEILLHRIVWSFAVVAVLLVVRRDRHWWAGVRRRPGALPRLTAAAVLIATNWLVYIWAVNHGHVVEAALGYYVNPLITVALGVAVLHEHLRRAQVVALGCGAAAVAVLTLAYGRMPWVALVLACSFAGYGFLKKAVPVGAVTSLAVETLVLLPVALAAMVALEVSGEAAFGHGSTGRDLLLVSLGVVTAVPLLLFGTAARRIPLSLLGLLQYLTPTLQLVCGVVVLDEGLPPARLAGFVLVWAALAVLAADAIAAGRGRPAASPGPLPAAEAA
ncbi:MAG TPA: EamA family transporter RarD [Acidimicrobiales bacterium]|nr:EamA family transporter RarD [Acidimicrobiales bacterium]